MSEKKIFNKKKTLPGQRYLWTWLGLDVQAEPMSPGHWMPPLSIKTPLKDGGVPIMSQVGTPIFVYYATSASLSTP